MNDSHLGADTGQSHHDIGVMGAFSIGIGGIVGLAVVAFIYEFLCSIIVARDRGGHGAESR